MEVNIAPTRKVTLLGLDNRSMKNLAWCAATYGVNRLYWIGGYVLCLEVYEKAFEHELRKQEFPVSQVCYAEFPKYERLYEIDKSFQIPVVDVSDMKLFQRILATILEHQKNLNSQGKNE